MRINLAGAVERMFSARMGARLAPYARIADNIISGTDDRSVSQRIAFVTFAVRVISAAIAYLSQILLARWMGDFEYGVFVVVWVVAVILGNLTCLGFGTVVVRLIPEYTVKGEKALLAGAIVGSGFYGFVTSTFFAVVGVLGLWAFSDVFANYYLLPLYLGAITLPMLAVGEVNEGVSRGFSWADLSLWPTYIVRPGLIIVFMWLAIELGYAADAVTAMGASIIGTYVTTLGQLLIIHLRVRKVVPLGERRYRPLFWASIALPIFIVEGFFNLLTNVDILVVGWMMTPDKVAIYFATVKTLALVHFVYFAVRAGGAQRFSAYYAAGDHARLAAFTRDTLHWTFWPSLAMVVVMLLLGKPLLLLFGASFAEGYPLLFVLAIGLIFRAAIGPAETLLIMAGQQGICAAVYTATFILNVSLNVSLIPNYGLMGAATATTIALVLEALVLYYVTYVRLGIRCSILDALRPVRAIEAN
ncbi:MAG: lipopolysaccharide biosynthesis protein [Rhizobiales bacterium]|nr:lipopolysaccharide biosynthesis protein [Hyphomicrobiales bacterium]